MNQTITLLIDAYRELNSKKLFWISLSLSLLVSLGFIMLGIDQQGISFLGYHLPLPVSTENISAGYFYRVMFSRLGVSMWLGFIANILALVSTGGIFPDFLASGSVDLYLSKPISRWRLFLTKYMVGLLFVALQVFAFVIGCLLVLRIRGGQWFPNLFLAIPAVLLLFSYLHCVCVLIGILTRSTIVSIMLTLVFWVIIVGAHRFESDYLLESKFKAEIVLARTDRQIAEFQHPDRSRQGFWKVDPQKRQAELVAQRQVDQQALDSANTWHRMAYLFEAVLPKTSDTIWLMDRWLITEEEEKRSGGEYSEEDTSNSPIPIALFYTSDDLRAKFQVQQALRNRPIAWAIGTSLLFEAVVVGVSVWIFCRRDF